MSPRRVQTHAVAQFECTGSACPDTCCVGWGMQLSAENVAHIRHAAPEIMADVLEEANGFVMRRDAGGACVRLEGGLCKIQRDYGASLLGDACHYFPRITRALGEMVVVSATLSCPEIARLTLLHDAPFALGPRQEVRTPYQLRNYLPPDILPDEALDIHQTFLAAAEDSRYTAEFNLLRISTVAQALTLLPPAQWKGASAFYVESAATRVPAAEASEIDLFNLLHAFAGLLAAHQVTHHNLLTLVAQAVQALGVTFSGQAQNITLSPDSPARAAALRQHMKEQSVALQPLLRRYVAAQISQSLFPFAGMGGGLAERAAIIGVRLATVKLMLATHAGVPTDEEVVRVMQTLSRFMDHMANAELLLEIYQETGWLREARLRALLDA